MLPARSLPEIRISSDDYHEVLRLAAAVGEELPYIAFYLERELRRAEICRPSEPAGLSMGMRAAFRIDGDAALRQGRLTYPQDTDPARGDIGILSPLGAALIGLRPGQSIDWMEDAQLHTVTLEAIGAAPD